MGTWGPGSFDNDAAADWAFGLADGGVAYVYDALMVVAETDGYVDADLGAAAVAAAETVARLSGGVWEESPYSEAVDDWVHAQSGEVPEELTAAATQAVERVAAPGSELFELWQDAGDHELAIWQHALADLVERLGA